MSGTSTTPGSDPAVADSWRRLSLALRTFLLCFAAIALSGIAVAIAIYPPSDATDGWFEAVWRIDAAFFVVALVMGVVSARRGRRAWLAGYAGTVVGGMVVIVVHWLLAPNSGMASVLVGAGVLGRNSDLANVLVGSVPSAIIVFAPLAAIAFLITGALIAGSRRLSGASASPQSTK
jgi:hypothetical protein